MLPPPAHVAVHGALIGYPGILVAPDPAYCWMGPFGAQGASVCVQMLLAFRKLSKFEPVVLKYCLPQASPSSAQASSCRESRSLVADAVSPLRPHTASPPASSSTTISMRTIPSATPRSPR